MPLVPEDLTKWDNESLLRAFEQRTELYKTLVGSLYPSIVFGELTDIGEECIRRTTFHPNWWREKGIVESSWTSPDGLVHSWNHGHGHVAGRHPDDPAKVITCFDCLSR